MPSIPQRRRVFFGCEGESEQSYGRLLDQLLKEQRNDLHLELVLLSGGDPLTLVERACEAVEKREKNEDFVARALLLDSDRSDKDRALDDKISPIVRRAKLIVIWQHPCHEAFLLRHLDGCTTLHPKTSNAAKSKLHQHWPNYRKGLPAMRLRDKIRTFEQVLRAAKIEDELGKFLTAIGCFI